MSQVLSPWGYLPDGWKLSTIDEEKTALFDYVANGSFASLAENVKYRETPDYAVLIRLVDYNNNFSGGFVYIDEHAYNYLSKSKLYGDEIIISNVGANVGTVFKAPRLNKKMSLAPNAICVKFKGCNDFYYYWLRSRIGQHNINSLISGSAQPKFNKTHFRSMPIPVPPIEIQESIASILSSLDDKIAVNRRICENLEAQAQALFKHWFIDFAPFKDGKFIESELGLIPEGWRVGKLKDILKDIETGKRPKGGAQVDGIPSIGAEKIEKISYYNFSSEKYISTDYFENMTKGKIKSGDVLLYKDGAYTGKSTLFMNDFPYSKCAVNEHVFLLRTENSKWQCWLYLLLSYEPIRKYIHTLASSKAAQPGLNQVELQSVATLIPPSIVLNDFESIINPLFTSIIQNLKENQRLSTLRDTLLPKLMSGQIKV